MIGRRGLLAGLGALLAAPAIIRKPGLLMPVKAAPRLILWGDGIHDDAPALQAIFDGRTDVLVRGDGVSYVRTELPRRHLEIQGNDQVFRITRPITIKWGQDVSMPRVVLATGLGDGFWGERNA